jgi:hypothetical protein
MLITHLHTVLGLRMGGATPLFLFHDDYDKRHRQSMLLNKPKEMKQMVE